MVMGLTVCPSCGKEQVRGWAGSSLQPRTLLAIGLTAAVLIAFNWFKQPAPHADSVSPPSASLPSR
ncbi:hypothetical protein CI41S_38520 [Bradyrhizobium ivorense]|nr:hypothetical protein CI41S_38520 [Bradyrhizobium ivorense]